MAFDSDTLNFIYASTQGFCHRCRRKLAFSRFGRDDGRGAWDIDAVSPHPKVTALLPGCLRCVQKPTPRLVPKAAPAPDIPDVRPASEPAGEAANQEPAANEDTPIRDTALVGGAAGAVLGGLWGAVLGGLIAIGLQLWG